MKKPEQIQNIVELYMLTAIVPGTISVVIRLCNTSCMAINLIVKRFCYFKTSCFVKYLAFSNFLPSSFFA